MINENLTKFKESEHPPWPQFYQILNDLKYWKLFFQNDLKAEASEVFDKDVESKSITLKEKLKDLESKLSDLDQKFEKFFVQFEKNWKNWETQDICQWIKILHNHEFVTNC